MAGVGEEEAGGGSLRPQLGLTVALPDTLGGHVVAIEVRGDATVADALAAAGAEGCRCCWQGEELPRRMALSDAGVGSEARLTALQPPVLLRWERWDDAVMQPGDGGRAMHKATSTDARGVRVGLCTAYGTPVSAGIHRWELRIDKCQDLNFGIVAGECPTVHPHVAQYAGLQQAPAGAASAGTCPEGHPLAAWTPPSNNFYCDECGEDVMAGQTLHTCGSCGFDICGGCIAAVSQRGGAAAAAGSGGWPTRHNLWTSPHAWVVHSDGTLVHAAEEYYQLSERGEAADASREPIPRQLRAGDVVACVCDCNELTVRFELNGEPAPHVFDLRAAGAAPPLRAALSVGGFGSGDGGTAVDPPD